MSRPHRIHARYAHQASIALRSGSAVIAGRTVNISHGGLCADLTEALPAGTDVAVDLELAFEDGEDAEPLHLPGQVAWCTPNGAAHRIGLGFRRLDADHAMYLMMFLRYLDPGRMRGPERPATIDELFG